MPILIDSLGNLLLLVVGSFWLLLLLISFCRAASYSILYTQHTHTRTSFEFHFTRDCWLSFCPSLTLTRSFFFSLSENSTDVVVVGPFFDLRCCCFCFYCNLWRAVVICLLLACGLKNAFSTTHIWGARTHSLASSQHTHTNTHARTHSLSRVTSMNAAARSCCFRHWFSPCTHILLANRSTWSATAHQSLVYLHCSTGLVHFPRLYAFFSRFARPYNERRRRKQREMVNARAGREADG